jgi:hypothetical protein
VTGLFPSQDGKKTGKRTKKAWKTLVPLLEWFHQAAMPFLESPALGKMEKRAWRDWRSLLEWFH